MAYQKPTDLDGFIGQMGKADMRIRAQLAEDLVNYLSDSENSLACSDLGLLIDGLIPWLSGSHFKVLEWNGITDSGSDRWERRRSSRPLKTNRRLLRLTR